VSDLAQATSMHAARRRSHLLTDLELFLMLRFALILALAATPVFAQSHSLVGDWAVSLAAGMRMENGVETPIMQAGTLKVVSQGDSLIATLAMPPVEGRPVRPPSRMAAKVGTGAHVFVLTSQATININGETSTKNVTSTFTLSATADALTGTVVRVLEGVDMPSSPQPVTGSRVKS
jgi:hypothetical protein